MRVLVSRSGPPDRPARTARISARIETAVSEGERCADVETRGPGDAVELVVGQAFVAQKAAPALLVATGADPADVERVTGKRAADHRQVEFVVVGENDHRSSQVQLSLRHGLVWPEEKELVGAGDSLGRGEARPGVGDQRPPAEELRGATEGFCRVDRAVDEEPRRRGIDVGENRAAGQLDDVTAAPAPRRLLQLRIMQPLADSLARDDDERHVRLFGLDELLDEDVDLAAAGQADAERHLVGDPVGEQPWRTAPKNLLGGEHDIALDTAAGDRPFEIAAVADEQLRADRTRRRFPRRHDRGDSHLAPHLAPTHGPLQRLVHRNQSSSGALSDRGRPCEDPRARAARRPGLRGRAGRSRGRSRGRRSRARRSRSARRRGSRRPTRAPA